MEHDSVGRAAAARRPAGLRRAPRRGVRARYPHSRLERCPSGLRSATGNRVWAERSIAGSNPALSASHGGTPGSPVCPKRLWPSGQTPGMRIGRRAVIITNPEKVYFPKPGLTKVDLVAYYLEVADCVLNHVRRRPMQMKRHPDGVEGFFFYQKRVPEPHPDWLETVHIEFPSG